MHHEEKHTKETEEKGNKSSLVAKCQRVETSGLEWDSKDVSLLFTTSIVHHSKKKKEALSQREANN